jgi:predicted O-methyltransferase YrrM
MNKIYNRLYSLYNGIHLKIFNLFKIPLASKKKYQSLHIDAQNKNYQKVDEFEKKYNFKINKIWFEKLALHTQVVVKKSEINYQHGRLLYTLLMDYINKRKENLEFCQIFETGTARGFSSICLSKALSDSNINGNIATVDVLPHKKKMIWNCIDDCYNFVSREDIVSRWQKEIKNITFYEGKSSEIMKNLNLKKIHFAFLDAHHIASEVMNEYNFVKSKQTKGDVIFFDDVTPNLYPGVVDALNIIIQSRDYAVEFLYVSEERQYAIARKN